MIFRPPSPGPNSYRLDERTLTVLDTQGRALWTRRFDPPVNPEAYRDPAHPRLAWFGDIDGDGRTELLFALSRRDAGAQSALICYSDAGEEKWRFSPGRMVATRKQVFHPPYAIAEIDAGRQGKDGVIAVASAHHLRYPGQVAVLSAGGELRREYWHAGNLGRVALRGGAHPVSALLPQPRVEPVQPRSADHAACGFRRSCMSWIRSFRCGR